MDFSEVRHWTIPVGNTRRNVAKVTDPNGRVLWRDYQYEPFTLSADTDIDIVITNNSSSDRYDFVVRGTAGSIPPNDTAGFRVTRDTPLVIRRRSYDTSVPDIMLNIQGLDIDNHDNTMPFKASGNLLSLITGSPTQEPTSTAYTMQGLFANSSIVDAHNLYFPKILYDNSFRIMFYRCERLVTAPVLPATTLAASCYGGMFLNCTRLEHTPLLPATTLEPTCYQQMFADCTNLLSAYNLPATTLAPYCCHQMFLNCENLVTAPVLPATTLADGCYYEMFYGCSRLNYISCAATQNIVTYTGNWVNGVQTTSGTFICPSSVEPGQPNGWTYGNDGIPGTSAIHWDVNP